MICPKCKACELDLDLVCPECDASFTADDIANAAAEQENKGCCTVLVDMMSVAQRRHHHTECVVLEDVLHRLRGRRNLTTAELRWAKP